MFADKKNKMRTNKKLFFRPSPPNPNLSTQRLCLRGTNGNNYELSVNDNGQLQISFNGKPITTISQNGSVMPVPVDIPIDGETILVSDPNVNIYPTDEASTVILAGSAFDSGTTINITNLGTTSAFITVPTGNNGFTSPDLANLIPFQFKILKMPPSTRLQFAPVVFQTGQYWSMTDEDVNTVSIAVQPLAQEITTEPIEQFKMSRNFVTGQALFFYIKSSDKNLYLKTGDRKSVIDGSGLYNLGPELQVTTNGDVQTFTNTHTFDDGSLAIATMEIAGGDNNIFYYTSSVELDIWDELQAANVPDFDITGRFRLIFADANPSIFYYATGTIKAIRMNGIFQPMIVMGSMNDILSTGGSKFSVLAINGIIVLATTTNTGALVQLASSADNYEFTTGNSLVGLGITPDTAFLRKQSGSTVKIILTDSSTKEKKTALLAVTYPNVTSSDIAIESIDEEVIEMIKSEPRQIVTTFEYVQNVQPIERYDTIQTLLPNEETEPVIHVVQTDTIVNVDVTPVYSNIDDIYITKSPILVPEPEPSPTLMEYVQQQPNNGIFVYPGEGPIVNFTISTILDILYP